MAKIKICGLRRPVDIDYANKLLPDYIGFILSPGYKRSIDYDTALQLKKRLDAKIKAVGVFVDDDIEKINSFVHDGIIDLVQLHGNEDNDFCNLVSAPVIKCLKQNNFDKADTYNVEYLMFDSGTGSGKTFDWSTIPNVKKPFFLAGGLNENNIKTAINKINPYCIDVSSSVEIDGAKDFNKMKMITECVKDE